MQLLGNLIWVVFGGALIALLYYLAGFLMCLSIIGIPFGLQLFKLGTFALWPFGHELVSRVSEPSGISIILNLLWICSRGCRVWLNESNILCLWIWQVTFFIHRSILVDFLLSS